MTDLMFLLLLFLLIATTLINPNALKLMLPKSSNQLKDKAMTTVSIQDAGHGKYRYYVELQEVGSIEGVERALKTRLDGQKDATVSLHCEKNFPARKAKSDWDIGLPIGMGGADYLNCPFYTKEEYVAFWEALCNAESAPVKDFEHDVFEACMPIEEMAARGEDTMRFGPLKPVGLIDPRNGKEAYAVVQLRQDNAAASLYNLVGFQTHLKWPEQRRVFGMIPGLENAEFVRFGVMHKNTYLNSPQLLDKHFNLRSNKRFYFAGQMTGVEGYVESAASGLMAGLAAARAVLELPEVEFPDVTAHGALANYISNPAIENFQPMNINYGLLPPLEAPKVDEDGKRIHPKERGRAKKRLQSIRAMEALKAWRDA